MCKVCRGRRRAASHLLARHDAPARARSAEVRRAVTRARDSQAAAEGATSTRVDSTTRPDQTRSVATEIINISEAKAQLSRLIEEVQKGRSIIIGKAGRPAARLVPYEARDGHRQPGALRGRIRVGEDFDELPGDVAVALGLADEP
ncbi:MAG: type II toxin-antitoxin system prevent-host-death family antitoxin [Deltaproteobacteria bacterium]|nr:type II toxin-antitoxin system prevent-host-death family antitoxin [Deltaproteobacteria bacterium]